MANMMAGMQLSGAAESGFGVTIVGFHCTSGETGAKMIELTARMPHPDQIVSYEDNGYVTFLAIKSSYLANHGTEEIKYFRREPHRFFQDLPKFLMSTKAQSITAVVLTGSLGSISLTILTSPAQPGV